MKRDPIHVEDDEWAVAADWVKERYDPRTPKNGVEYMGYVIHAGGLGQILRRFLPYRLADIVIPKCRKKVFHNMTVFDIEALRMMFDFLGVEKDKHIYGAIPGMTQCKSAKPSTAP